MSNEKYKNIIFPDGKDFAFTDFDDTDLANLTNIKAVYSLLSEYGFRIFKSVWPLEGNKKPIAGGFTCMNKDYLKWVISLQKLGFEIGYHNTTFHSSLRHETVKGIERFHELFGHYPISMANHTDCE